MNEIDEGERYDVNERVCMSNNSILKNSYRESLSRAPASCPRNLGTTYM